MIRGMWRLALLICAGSVMVFAQSTPYVLTQFPVSMVGPDTSIWIKWSGQARTGQVPPDSGIIYYDRSPGGGNLANYRYTVTPDSSNVYFTGSPPQRGIRFNPKNQTDMNAGTFYYVVAWPMASDTFYSNELKLIIESKQSVELVGPSGTISELTPEFSWKTNPGVPFYHIILSDEEIKASDDGGSFSLEGLSIVWQAIVPHPSSQITYGSPDPSGTITAAPPPLSPGLTYSWAVLNNYGNHPAYTSSVFNLPKNFTIEGDTLRRPVSTYPVNVELNSSSDSAVTLKWTNLDSRANTYKIYVYMSSDFESVDAQLVVWENEVTGGQFTGDTASVTVNAKAILTRNHYTWRVVAVDDRGAGSMGDTVSFDYESPTGTMKVYTKENVVSGSDTIVTAVALAEIQVEVLDGSLEAPLAFYTDNNGALSRSRPAGTYRITAVKDGFKDITKTVSITDNGESNDTLFMERVDAVVFGKVLDAQGNGINLATVWGVSERGDTVTALSDNLGSYSLECYESDWTVWVTKTGYGDAAPRDTSVSYGQNVQMSSFTLAPRPFTLSGIVQNSSGTPLLGARVRLYRDNVLVHEVPSTSEKGVFSFAVDAGTCKLTAQKTGFTSYSQSIDISSSREITVTLNAGAALVNGYIIGYSWVNGSRTYAPITEAGVVFIPSDGGDTFKTVSDATYGDYRISLPGDRTYTVRPSADGFAVPGSYGTITTEARKTHTWNDTLRALGMISGTVRMSADGSTVGGVTVTCKSLNAGTISGSGKSQSNGYFEVRNLGDDTVILKAGKVGFVLDSVVRNDTVAIVDGRSLVNDTVDATALTLYVSPGNKTILWSINDGSDNTGAVKIQSPFIKTLKATDSLKETGSGEYIVVIDAVADSVLDLSRHSFTVADTDTVYTDAVSLPVTHTVTDSYTISNDSITLRVRSSTSLDSVRLYYKAASARSYDSVANTSGGTSVSINIVPPKDGAMMHYYFVAYIGDDQYGYVQEPFRAYVRPNPKLSKIEIVPGAGDTLMFPASFDMRFSFRGYYGSTFLPRESIDTQAVAWEIVSAQSGGCRLLADRGLDVILRTGSDSTPELVELKATISDTSTTKMMSGVDPYVSIFFKVSGSRLDSIFIRRIDSKAPGAITSSGIDKALFKAEGVDAKGNTVALTPEEWYIAPDSAVAGTIEKGAFLPKRNFVGNVRIFARAGRLISEYYNDARAGLNIKFVILPRAEPDTVGDGRGITLVFPDSVVGAGNSGLLSVDIPVLRNQVQRGLGDYKIIGNAYDILEENNVAFEDSLRIIFNVPEAYQGKARSGAGLFFIARWDEDSLHWDTLSRSVVAENGKTVSARIAHFSRYALMAQSGELDCHVTITPNPFSPYVVPVEDMPSAKHAGVCITLSPQGAGDDAVTMRVRIYTVTGDLVASMIHKSAKTGKTYYLWWNGKTTTREAVWQSDSDPLVMGNGNLCRNGRYLLFVSVSDVYENIKKSLKNIVLVK